MIFGVDISRFWFNVEPGRTDNECWEWTAAVNRLGYGRFGVNGEVDGAHRVAYELEIGPIPAGAEVHHRCENKRCVNPGHLVALTVKEHSAEHGLSGWAAIHAAAETCKYGHAFDGHDGRQRTCSICQRRIKNESARRRRAMGYTQQRTPEQRHAEYERRKARHA